MAKINRTLVLNHVAVTDNVVTTRMGIGSNLVLAQALASRPAGLSRTARQALGYRELLDHLAQGTPLSDAVDAAIRRTRKFSRRQRSWFRRDPRITWLGSPRNPLDLLPALLGDWSSS